MIVPDIYLNMVMIVPEIYLRHSGNSTMPRQPDLLLIWMAPHWVQLQLQPIGSLPSISLSKCSTWNIRHNYKVNLFFLLCLFRLPPPPPYHYHHHSHHQLWHYRHLWHYHYHHHYHHLWHHHQQHNEIFTTRWTSCTPAGGSQCGSGVQTRGSQCFRSGWCLVMIMMRMSRVMRMRDGQDDNDDNDDVLPTRGGQSFGYAWCFTSLQ